MVRKEKDTGENEESDKEKIGRDWLERRKKLMRKEKETGKRMKRLMRKEEHTGEK